MEEIDEETLNDPGVFATDETVGSCETFQWLGDDAERVYNDAWTEVLSAE